MLTVYLRFAYSFYLRGSSLLLLMLLQLLLSQHLQMGLMGDRLLCQLHTCSWKKDSIGVTMRSFKENSGAKPK